MEITQSVMRNLTLVTVGEGHALLLRLFANGGKTGERNAAISVYLFKFIITFHIFLKISAQVISGEVKWSNLQKHLLSRRGCSF